jgi:hypothetical protein
MRALALTFLIMAANSAFAADLSTKVVLCGPMAGDSDVDRRIENSCSIDRREFDGISQIEVSSDSTRHVEISVFDRLPMDNGARGPIVTLANFKIAFDDEEEAKNFVKLVVEGRIAKIVAISGKTPEASFQNLTGVVRLRSKNVFFYRVPENAK